MTLSALLSLPITIVRRSDSDETDELGNIIPGTTDVETVGELQQVRRDEPDDAGELSVTEWRLFLPAGTQITTGDAVIAGGAVYEVIGDAWHTRNPRTSVESHVECSLRQTSSDEEGS